MILLVSGTTTTANTAPTVRGSNGKAGGSESKSNARGGGNAVLHMYEGKITWPRFRELFLADDDM